MKRTMRTTLWKDLPDDVAADILSRLPVKTLIRLRCVCKSWNATITHHSFITKHLNRACLYNNNNDYYQCLKINSSRQQIWCLFSDCPVNHDVEFAFPFSYRRWELEFVGGLNGLVCLSHKLSRTIYLWNPSIRKHKTLSCSSSTFTPQLSLTRNFVALGFGFYSQTNDYKIVRILYFRDDHMILNFNTPPLVEVYTLSTDSWKKIETHVPCLLFNQQFDAFINGSAHWVASISMEDWHSRDTIESFDIGGEVFGEMMLPSNQIVRFKQAFLRLAVLMESLALCVSFRGNGHCEIWIMREYGVAKSWTKQFTIIRPQERFLQPLGFMKNKKLLLEVEVMNRRLVSYDLESLHLIDLEMRGAVCASKVFSFMETLVLL